MSALAKTLFSVSRFIRCTGGPLKFLQPNTVHGGKEILLTVRQSSSRKSKKISLLSDVEDYIVSDFSLTDLQKQIDKETLPAAITTSSLLDQCVTFDDVLSELQKSIHAGLLWKDELNLYYEAFHRIYKESTGTVDVYTVRSLNQHLINNLYFQFLLKETLKHAPRFTSYQISNIFAKLIYLHIPLESNTMCLYISILQDKVNELFPSDVMLCLSLIKNTEHYSSKHLDSLQNGLCLHLNNQALSGPNFNRILTATPMIHRLNLLGRMSIYKACSRDLYEALTQSIIETLRKRRVYERISMHEAEALLKTLKVFSKRQKPFLLKVVTENYVENKDMFSETQQKLVRRILSQEHEYLTSNRFLLSGEEMLDSEDTSFKHERWQDDVGE